MPAYEDIVLIALNKLRPEPHNSYFQLFVSDKKVRERAFEYVLTKHAHELPEDSHVSQLLTVIFAIAKAHELELKELEGDKMNVERVLAIGEGFRKNLIASATIEERLAGLKPEELFAMFKPEERVMGLRPEELFAMFKPEDRLMGLRPEERVMGLRPEERVMGLRPEELMMMFKPEERLAGLDTEEKRLLLKELQASLAEEEAAESEENVDELVEDGADSDGSDVTEE